MDLFELILLLIFVLITPVIISSLFKYLILKIIFKSDKIGFIKILKRSWIFSLLWFIAICSYLIFFYDEYGDSLILRILVAIVFLIFIITINYFSVKRLRSLNLIYETTFNKLQYIYYSFNILFFIIAFIFLLPNHVKKIESIQAFRNMSNLNFIKCNLKLTSLNEKLPSSNIVYSEFNETENKLVVVLRLDDVLEKKLLAKYDFKKITQSYIDSNYIILNKERIEDINQKIDFNSVITYNIGKSNVYAFYNLLPAFKINLISSYHYSDILPFDCKEYIHYSCNLDVIYDSTSHYLILIEDFITSEDGA